MRVTKVHALGEVVVIAAQGISPAPSQLERPFALEITAGDFAFAAGHRRNAISLVAGTLNSAASFSIAADSFVRLLYRAKPDGFIGDLIDVPPYSALVVRASWPCQRVSAGKVIDAKVVLNDPALRDLKMPSVRSFIADGSHDTRGLTRLEDDRHGAGLGSSEVRIDELVATTLRRLHDWDIALRGPFAHPALKLIWRSRAGWTASRDRFVNTY
jgi:hypothetical protein